eukprot:Sdes_comp20494_c0_seq4m14933
MNRRASRPRGILVADLATGGVSRKGPEMKEAIIVSGDDQVSIVPFGPLREGARTDGRDGEGGRSGGDSHHELGHIEIPEVEEGQGDAVHGEEREAVLGGDEDVAREIVDDNVEDGRVHFAVAVTHVFERVEIPDDAAAIGGSRHNDAKGARGAQGAHGVPVPIQGLFEDESDLLVGRVGHLPHRHDRIFAARDQRASVGENHAGNLAQMHPFVDGDDFRGVAHVDPNRAVCVPPTDEFVALKRRHKQLARSAHKGSIGHIRGHHKIPHGLLQGLLHRHWSGDQFVDATVEGGGRRGVCFAGRMRFSKELAGSLPEIVDD